MTAFTFATRSLIRQPGRAILGIAGIAAAGALLFDMLLLSRGLVLSMQDLLDDIGFDVRVTATDAAPLAGPRIGDLQATLTAIAALPEVDDVVPLRMGQAEVQVDGRQTTITLIGADVTRQRPWSLVSGQNLQPAPTDADEPLLLVNQRLADTLRVAPGADVALRGSCRQGSSVPPTLFRVGGVADFPFDQASQLTAVTTLRDLVRTCGDDNANEADMLMIAATPAHGPDEAVQAIRRVRADLEPFTNEELVARFQEVEFTYFRQISAVLAAITLFFGLLLITVLLSVSTNQRLGEIAALRALGFSRRRMMADVLWRSALLVGAGGLLAVPLGLGLSTWLDNILRTMPGIPIDLHFFVFEPRALLLHVAFLVVTAILAALYPMRLVASLPIAQTLRNEAVS